MTTQTKTTWRMAKLGELVVPKGSVSGPFGSNIHSKFFTQGGVPVIRGNNLAIGFNPSRYIDDDYIFLSEKKAEELSKSEALPKDIIVTARGTIGQTGIIPKKARYKKYILSANQLRFRIDRKIANPLFVYYWLASKRMVRMMQNVSVNVGVPNLNLGNTRNLPVPIPPLSVQDQIADILSAFDDKIEVNNKIAKTLEQMAQAIFREWFVYFRFPEYEKVEFVDSELGKIPKGWEVKKIKDIAKIKKGISYSSEEIKDNSVGLPMINLANFQRGGGFNPDGIKFYTGGYKTTDLVKPGDIVIAMTDLTSNREVIGHPARVPSYIHWDKMLISLDVCAVDTEKLYIEFLYYLMLRKEFSYLMASSAGGTNVAHLSKSVIENYSFVLPERNLIKEFQDFIRPIFDQINKVELENQKLAALRDLLLSKLMKGEIRV